MSNCTQQSAGCQKGRPIKAGRLYYMKLLLITQSQKQETDRQQDRQTDRHTNINRQAIYILLHLNIHYMACLGSLHSPSAHNYTAH